MNYFKKKSLPKSKTCSTDHVLEKVISDNELMNDCKRFLATGLVSNELQEKIAHYQQQDSSISVYEVVEMIFDHRERLTKKV